MTYRNALLLALAPAALAACSKHAAPDDASSIGADATAEVADPVPASAAMPAEEPTADPSSMPATPAAEIIPLSAQGRWGLVPADCTSTRGDNKGLMTVGETTLKFYESLATLGKIKEASPTRIAANFAYEGEGMEWKRDVTMDVQDAGKTLILREYGDDAPPGPRKYTRCG